LTQEDLSERGEILVGPDTYRLTAPLFEFEALEPMRVKDKAEPVPVYRLLAARAVPEAVRGIEGLESPLVGREAEFHALAEAIERLRAGVGGIVIYWNETKLAVAECPIPRTARGWLGLGVLVATHRGMKAWNH
jgi:hypothetical protein